jgi:hypothetical protein
MKTVTVKTGKNKKGTFAVTKDRNKTYKIIETSRFWTFKHSVGFEFEKVVEWRSSV